MGYVMLSLALFLLATFTPKQELPAPPEPPREFRAAWIATVANIDWPSRNSLTTAQSQRELVAIFDRAQRLNMNAIVFQARPHADALYESPHEPWSEYLSGRQGQSPSPRWDPLQFSIDEARKRGMELHVWFNPYRAGHPSAKSPLAANHIGRTHPHLVRRYGKQTWLDPADPAVQQHSLKVILDVVRRYDIDGVHIDDYFYPYKERGADKKILDFPDGPTWTRYVNSGGKLSRDDWRRSQVDSFVKRLYEGVKAEKRWVKVGISPFGVYRPNIPAGIPAGVDQYRDLYADARKWLIEGWCDYYSPQLYWRTDSKQSYPILLNWWISQNTMGRHIWPGNFTSAIAAANGNWDPTEIVRQIELTQRTPGATGNVHFSMKALTLDYKGISGLLEKGPYAAPALVPASPWLDSTPPPAPILQAQAAGEALQVSWNPPRGCEPLLAWAFWTRYGGRWQYQTLGITARARQIPLQSNGARLEAVVLAGVDRGGNLGERAGWTPR
jgi:uncharacterized lipoprotein YddW (UPF0748 family)